MMKIVNFNNGWEYRRIGGDTWESVDLPHDAMIGGERSPDADSGTNAGWYLCHDYEYKKTFDVTDEYDGKRVTFEFEGVYRNAEVYINGNKASERPYGYTNFYVDAYKHLRSGANEIRVIARNADQPNSRWYSGAGVYRPVKMYIADEKHILLNGIRVRTVSINPAAVEVTVKTSHAGCVKITIDKTTFEADSDGEHTFTVEIPNASLWTPDNPKLYTCKAEFEGDAAETVFGIRTLSVTAADGFCMNGDRIIIRGACIHHDNGLLGARCYADAERRKIRILKENGYNAIRSAHNPCSKAMLDACDELGMMVMDEYVDMWYIHKTRYDYADYIMDWYERDIADMIDKDYNHPSVIMYSLGNEVSETAQEKGIEFFNKMKAVIKKLDDTRAVTTGVNIFFNYLSSMGMGVYSDKKAEDNPQKKVGSEFFNTVAGILGAGFMKWGATLRGSDKKTKDAFAAMDVAGYNYGINRYKNDVKKYPDRIILGSETFCVDAYKFYEFAKENNALIGDFVWAGMDYLGEVGIGSREYRDYAPQFTHGVGWISAGSGRIDLTGKPLAEAGYTRVAFGLEDKPVIAVIPVNHTNDKHSPSSWKMTNAVESWSWNGFSGRKAKIEVYVRAAKVELYVNGVKAGVKKFKKNCLFKFKTTYRDGEITAVAYDVGGKELSRSSLKTAGNETVLSVCPESGTVTPDGLCYVRLKFTDKAGIVKPLERGRIAVTVSGGKLLGLGHACPYNADGFAKSDTDTYYGEAMAIIKSGKQGTVGISAASGSLAGRAEIIIK